MVQMLALMKYGDRAASTRQRLLQYQEYLSRQGIKIRPFYLLNNDYLEQTYQGKLGSFFSISNSYLARARLLSNARSFDLIWVHYESFPYLPGVAERLTLLSGKPLVYDFDDAIFHQYDAHPNPLIRRFLGHKLQPLLRGASLCICGNSYLRAYADRFSRRTEIVPTVVDTTAYAPASRARDAAQPVTVGWIGSPSTWGFVRPFLQLLERLSEELHLIIRVVGAGPVGVAHPRFEFFDWSERNEIAFIQGMDIGIMPLPDEPWARGKCGYKLVQYMACGLPVIASPVGMNAEIVNHGGNGFLALGEHEWETALRCLAANPELRRDMGARGRHKIVNEYSLLVHGPRLAALLRDVVDVARGGSCIQNRPTEWSS